MTLLFALLGQLVGSCVNWLAVRLPRRVSRRASRAHASRALPAIWQLMASVLGRRDAGYARRWCWADVAVEGCAALLLAQLWARYGPTWQLLLLGSLCTFLLLLAVIDLRHRLVPNALLYPAALVTLCLSIVLPGPSVRSALLGGGVGLAVFLLAALVRPAGRGGGDVKLAALIGLMVGFPDVLCALALGILAGGVTAIALLAARRAGPKSGCPARHSCAWAAPSP